jgi:hypothetical protein
MRRTDYIHERDMDYVHFLVKVSEGKKSHPMTLKTLSRQGHLNKPFCVS